MLWQLLMQRGTYWCSNCVMCFCHWHAYVEKVIGVVCALSEPHCVSRALIQSCCIMGAVTCGCWREAVLQTAIAVVVRGCVISWDGSSRGVSVCSLMSVGFSMNP